MQLEQVRDRSLFKRGWGGGGTGGEATKLKKILAQNCDPPQI